MNINKTKAINNKNDKPQWYIIDANQQILGRLSSKIAQLLKGKNNYLYAPHIETNVYIIIINANSINVSGNKKKQKLYKRHSGRPGGMKIETFNQLQQRQPTQIIEKAIKGMLPKNKLGRKMFTKLKVYPQDTHPHLAQQPSNITI